MSLQEVFAWWPAPITVLHAREICQAASTAGFSELADYAGQSPYGLKLAAIVTQAKKRPVIFVDADILWFRDPALLLGRSRCRGTNLERCEKATATNVETWRRGIARQVLEPPFVNSGIVALHGEIMTPALLRSMVQDALRDPQDSSCEQTIIATAVKLGGGLFPEKMSLVEFDDVR